jgi:hypothetical protein
MSDRPRPIFTSVSPRRARGTGRRRRRPDRTLDALLAVAFLVAVAVVVIVAVVGGASDLP